MEKNNNNNLSNSLVFGRWPQTKIESCFVRIKINLILLQIVLHLTALLNETHSEIRHRHLSLSRRC